MKQILLPISLGFVLAFSSSVNAEIKRDCGVLTEAANSPVVVEHLLPLPQDFSRHSKNIMTVSENGGYNYLHSIERVVSTPVISSRNASYKKDNIPYSKASLKGKSFSGYISYGMTKGWHELNMSIPKLVWEETTSTLCTAGFVRNGDLYAFYTVATMQGISDAGLRRMDLLTGEVLETNAFELFDSYSKVTSDVAYDPEADIAYLVTYNDSGDGYIMQQLDIDNLTFTNLGVTLYDPPMAMTWCPADKSVYMLTFAGDLKRYDVNTKKMQQVCSYEYTFDEYSGAMVYSPKDDAFVGCVAGIDNMTGASTCDVVLMTKAGGISMVSRLDYDYQWSMLYTTDVYAAPDAPCAAQASLNVNDPSTSGVIDVTLPSTTNDGTLINGKVYVQVEIDDELQKGAYSGTPGSNISISVNVLEGEHEFSVIPFILSDDGKVYGLATKLQHFFGYDNPAAPKNVVLSQTKVTWDAVTIGEHGGYINSSDILYDVYIDDVKVNTSSIKTTSLDITIPQNGKLSHVAKVIAFANGKYSEEGVSSPIYNTGVLTLPVDLSPDDGAVDLPKDVISMFTVVKDPMNTDELRGWRYDDQNEHSGGFYCLCPLKSSKGDIADEWLFLPPIKFDDANSFYRFEMEVWATDHYFAADENYEVVLCSKPDGKNPIIIKDEVTVTPSKKFEHSEVLFNVPKTGNYYIGVHYKSPIGTFRLYARNFKVEKINSTNESPAQVDNLFAEAADKGELAANITFKMPMNSIDGNSLDIDTKITAKIESQASEIPVTVTGTPGQLMTAKVPALQGDNLFKVTTSSDKGIGKMTEISVYCGVYAPGMVAVDYKISADDNTVTLSWVLDEYNHEGQYVGPKSCSFSVFRKVGENWREAANVGNQTSWSFTNPNPDIQDVFEFAVVATNVAGTSPEMTTIGMILGKPYEIPYTETFQLEGDYINMKEPIMIENLTYLPAMWEFVDPASVDETAANISGVALCARGESVTQITLPKFSTKGSYNVKFQLNAFFGNRFPEMIGIYASSPDETLTNIINFTKDDGNGWENKLISLPSSFQNKEWISITIRVSLNEYAQAFLIDSYSIKNFPGKVMTITDFKGSTRCVVGETGEYEVTIENAGNEREPFPEYTVEVVGNNGTFKVTDTECSDTEIAPGRLAKIKFKYTPKNADVGNIKFVVTLPGQPESAVSKMEINAVVLEAMLPIVDDLTGSVDCNDVKLSWTQPKYVENFEAFEPWDYSEKMRGFSNIDMDGARVYSPEGVTYPGKNMPKAYQVFNTSITSNELFAAHSGEQYLLAMSSRGGAATDNWLISPEVIGGTPLSFWVNLLSSDFPETLVVMASSTNDDPGSFEEIPDGVISLTETGWKQYSFVLPDKAKFFALRHVSDAGADLFGLMVDDLSFKPHDLGGEVVGYNVYRDDKLVGSNIATTSFVDKDVDTSVPVRYYVKSVGVVENETVESARSNILWIENSGITIGSDDKTRQLISSDGCIILKGFENGMNVHVFNAAGVAIVNTVIDNNPTTIKLPSGIYIVMCGETYSKIAVY